MEEEEEEIVGILFLLLMGFRDTLPEAGGERLVTFRCGSDRETGQEIKKYLTRRY